MGWDQNQDDEVEYDRRRDALGADAPGVIKFEKLTIAEAQAKPGGLRGQFVEGMKACIGLGAGNTPDGRRAAYAQVNFPLGGAGASATEKQLALGPCPGSSSCGTFIRGMWQLFGIGRPVGPANRDRQFRAAYLTDSVLAQIGLFAADSGALHGTFSGAIRDQPVSAPPEIPVVPIANGDLDKMDAGDVWFTGHHIFTLVEKPRRWKKLGSLQLWEVPTVEGGQGPFFGDALGRQNGGANNDAGCRGIKAHTYTASFDGFKLEVRSDDGKTTTQIAWWVEFNQLALWGGYVWVPRVQTKLPGVP
jgi:hypothetical protein